MIIDAQNLLSGSQASGASVVGQAVTATAISTNVIDTNPGGVAPNTTRGLGFKARLVIQALEAATAAGAATVTFTLESDSTANLATAPVVHWDSGPIGKATLIAGYKVADISLPSGKTVKRYLGLRYTVATGPLTAGTFVASIGMGSDQYAHYEDNITIS